MAIQDDDRSRLLADLIVARPRLPPLPPSQRPAPHPQAAQSNGGWLPLVWGSAACQVPKARARTPKPPLAASTQQDALLVPPPGCRRRSPHSPAAACLPPRLTGTASRPPHATARACLVCGGVGAAAQKNTQRGHTEPQTRGVRRRQAGLDTTSPRLLPSNPLRPRCRPIQAATTRSDAPPHEGPQTAGGCVMDGHAAAIRQRPSQAARQTVEAALNQSRSVLLLAATRPRAAINLHPTNRPGRTQGQPN